MGSWQLRLGALIIFQGLVTGTVAGFDEKEDLAKHILSGWNRYVESRDEDVSFVINVESSESQNGSVTKSDSTQTGEASFSSGNIFIRFEERALGCNPHYLFELRREKNQPVWGIETLEKSDYSVSYWNSPISIISEVMWPTAGILSICFVDNMRILSFERKLLNNEPVIEFEFSIDRFANPNPMLQDNPKQKGTCVVRDGGNFVPLKVEIEFQTEGNDTFPDGKVGKVVSEMQYDGSRLSEIKWNYFCKVNKRQIEATISRSLIFTSIEPDIASSERFSITRLGLPEPKHLISPSNSYWRIAAGFAILSTLGAIFLKYQRSKNRT